MRLHCWFDFEDGYYLDDDTRVSGHTFRDALWSIEIGMGGRVDWDASFGVRQGSVTLMCAEAVHGSQFGAKKRRAA